jgi:tetratricopeptide (TPR) repeat protein
VAEDSTHEWGLALLARGDLDGAIATFDAVIARDASHAGAWFSKGEALERQGNEAGAGACYERASELRPDDAEARYRLGGVAHQLARVDLHRAEAGSRWNTGMRGAGSRLRPSSATGRHA